MDKNLALSAVELVLRSELNCSDSMESDSFFWFGLFSFSELIDKVIIIIIIIIIQLL